jgi:hypothetical protein
LGLHLDVDGIGQLDHVEWAIALDGHAQRRLQDHVQGGQLAGWVSLLQNGATAEAVQAGFLGSNEAYSNRS